MRQVESSSSDSENDDSYTGKYPFDVKAHAALCALVPYDQRKFLGPKNEDWTVVGPRGKPHKGIPVAVPQSEGKMRHHERVFRDLFYAYTGRKILDFKLTPESSKYISMLTSARERDNVLSTLFSSRPVIWDLFAGSGADVYSFLSNLWPKTVVACQRSVRDGVSHGSEYEKSKNEYKVLTKNIQAYVDVFPELKLKIYTEGRMDPFPALSAGEGHGIPSTADTPPVIKCKHLLAEDFINTQEGAEVDMVYLDPSWDDEHDSDENPLKYELSPKQLFDRLERIIWGPIRRKNIKVGCYVIKTRWNWLKVQEYLPSINSEYIARYSVEAQPFRHVLDQPGPYGAIKGIYHYMILVHRDYETIEVKNTQMYWDIVQNGKPVWIKRDTVVPIYKPMYTHRPSNPVYTEEDPKNVDDYFKVDPMKAGKHHQRIIAHDQGRRRTYDAHKVFHPPTDQAKA
jgi:hypothetical protein